MWNQQLKAYVYRIGRDYIELSNGKIIRLEDISEDEYEMLKEHGYIIREFER